MMWLLYDFCWQSTEVQQRLHITNIKGTHIFIKLQEPYMFYS